MKIKGFLLIAASVLCTTQVWAGILSVPSPYSSIQSAINDANNGDTVIVSPGTYQENINFLGKAITVISLNPDDPNIVAATIIDGNAPDDSNFASVVTFNSGEGNDSVLNGFTVTGGTGTWLLVSREYKGLQWERCGGGVICYNMSQPTISKNVFTGNFAGQGGGIYVYGDPVNPDDPSAPPVHVSPAISGNTFIQNQVFEECGFVPPDTNYPSSNGGDGGAIVGFQGCDALITGNLIEDNHADWYGGGIHLRQWSNGCIEDNQIIGNDSRLGAGIHVTYMSSPSIRNNIIKSNLAPPLGGGGIYIMFHSDPLIERNFIAENESRFGAGISIYAESRPVIRNNIIVGNKSGSTIYSTSSAEPVITHNTITANDTKLTGAGIFCQTWALIENNIINSNSAGYGIYTLLGMEPVIRYNNVWGNELGNYAGDLSEQTGINGNISVAPSFIDANNDDYRLNYNCSCINAGDPNLTGEGLTDYDDEPRKLGQYVDIGADEAWPVWNFDGGGRYGNIQQAIDDANDYDTIIVTVGTYTGPGNRDIDFDGKAVTLQSIEPDNPDIVGSTIIDCQGSPEDAHRGFYFHSSEDADSIIDGLTITGGGGSYYGAICCMWSSSPTIKNCIIRDNSMNDHGGGIYCGDNSNPTIADCFIHSNTFTTVGYGGGIYCYKSSPIITNCIITDNSAVGHGRHGGGICCWGNQDGGSDALVVNCIVSGNSADHRGGGLYAYWSSPTFVNCTVIGNEALEGGGIACFRESNPEVVNCIVRNNRAPDGNQLALIDTMRVWGVSILTEMTVSFSNIEGGQEEVCVDPGMILHWGAGNIDIEPNFVDAGCWDDANTPAEPNDDFFVVGNYHLLPTSSGIDVGDNNSVNATIDIDGEQRLFNGVVDMGADEVVTNPVDLNNDGIVDYSELAVLTDEWLQGSELQSDFYDDNFIDFADFAVLAEQWLWTGGWYQ